MVNNSFSGDIINPIIDARLQMSLSSTGLAKRLGLSKQYISRAEAGTYTSLNPALLNWAAHALSIETLSVTKRYQMFQQARRRATIETINPHRLERHNSRVEGFKLFEHWRAGYWPSSMAFANAFCIHPETVRAYEEGIRPEMPLSIRNVLKEANLLEIDWSEVKPHTVA